MDIMETLGQSFGQEVIGTVAAKMGIDPSMAKVAIAALTQNHAVPGDTVQQSAQQTGISSDVLGQMLGHLGGEGGLGALVGALGGTAPQGAGTTPQGGLGGILSGLGGLGAIASSLDQDGDGNPLDDIAGMLGRK